MVDRAGAVNSRDSAPDPLVGRVINDKFKVLAFIARGGMGKVYRAEQQPLGRICALKVLNAQYTGDHDPEFHKRFFREASLTSKLRHPNTVTIFDYGQTNDGVYYMAMEYLEGYTLHRAIRQVGHIPEERAAYIARQICRSLREAHLLGVVHRDLKPANIYLLEHGDEPDFVKVLDFGLVKDIAAGSEDLTHAGLYMGSPKYMAPEQMSGGTIDARTDIYGLGIILYEMMTGKVPFDRPRSLDILMAHQKEAPPPLGKMNPAARVSPGMEEVIFRCMAKDPNDRFRSMDEVLAALKRLGPAAVAEPSTSLGDRPSAIEGGASRIIRGTSGLDGASAAMAIPEEAIEPVAEAPAPPLPAADDEPVRKSASLPVVLFVLAAGAFAGSLVYVKSRPTPAPPLGSAASVAPAIQSAASAAEPVPEVSVDALAPAPPAAAPAPTPKVVAPTPPPVLAAPRPAAPRPAAPAATKSAPDCNPTYYYDPDGNKHFKPECFAR